MKTHLLVVGATLALAAAACGGGGGGGGTVNNPGKPGGPTTASGVAVNEGAKEKFEAALAAFNAHDKAGDWNESACS